MYALKRYLLSISFVPATLLGPWETLESKKLLSGTSLSSAVDRCSSNNHTKTQRSLKSRNSVLWGCITKGPILQPEGSWKASWRMIGFWVQVWEIHLPVNDGVVIRRGEGDRRLSSYFFLTVLLKCDKVPLLKTVVSHLYLSMNEILILFLENVCWRGMKRKSGSCILKRKVIKKQERGIRQKKKTRALRKTCWFCILLQLPNLSHDLISSHRAWKLVGRSLAWNHPCPEPAFLEARGGSYLCNMI